MKRNLRTEETKRILMRTQEAKQILWVLAVSCVLTAFAVAAPASPGEPATAATPAAEKAKDQPQMQKCELHGGQASATSAGDFETLFAPDGIRVYLYTTDKAPSMVEGVKGKVVFKFAGGKAQEAPLVMEVPDQKEPAVYFCPMHPDVVQMKPGVCEKCGGMKLYTQNRLFGKADLSKAKPGSVSAAVTLQGISGMVTEASFTATNAAVAGAGKKSGAEKGARKVEGQTGAKKVGGAEKMN